MERQTTRSPEETWALGKTLGEGSVPGTTILLEGDLGTGKTTFVQGLAAGLGVEGLVVSPSFVIVHEYSRGMRVQGRGLKGEGALRSPSTISPQPSVLRHLDLYRLSDPAVDLDRIGFPELLHDPVAITVIEWADRLPKPLVFSGPIIRVRFAHGLAPEERVLVFSHHPSSASLA